MPHTALYRRKRPQAFAQMVGQEHIVRALTHQVRTGQLSHAYLFCGTRGTGKTSAAKILARAVNCLQPADNGDPCNTCEMCAAILAERTLDVHEIDAASNNGVDNIRDLREQVRHQPAHARYRVYIVDEVHMLSGSAFNALLKTLEEPPAHVIFILATTDPQKIPATILSRCQRYDFRRIGDAEMIAAMQAALQEEGITYDADALSYIAYHSDGAMRDAYSLLDQCISQGGGNLTQADVRQMLGAADRLTLESFTAALLAGDAATLMRITDEAMAAGRDVAQLAADITRHMRDILVAALTEGKDDAHTPTLLSHITAFSELLREMRFAPHQRTAFEICVLKQAAGGTQAAQQPTTPQPAPAPTTPQPAPPQPTPQPTPPPAAPQALSPSNWPAFCRSLKMPLQMFCAKCEVRLSDNILTITAPDQVLLDNLKGKSVIIREALEDYFKLQTPPTLAFTLHAGYNTTSDTPQDWASLGTETNEQGGF
jgi:DNA polymerase III subunit gamma/tau